MEVDVPVRIQSISSLAEHLHWTVSNGQATFAPVHGSWRATVRRLHRSAGESGFHVAIVDRTGAIRFTAETADLSEAVRYAERGVLSRNALRLVPRG